MLEQHGTDDPTRTGSLSTGMMTAHHGQGKLWSSIEHRTAWNACTQDGITNSQAPAKKLSGMLNSLCRSSRSTTYCDHSNMLGGSMGIVGQLCSISHLKAAVEAQQPPATVSSSPGG